MCYSPTACQIIESMLERKTGAAARTADIVASVTK